MATVFYMMEWSKRGRWGKKGRKNPKHRKVKRKTQSGRRDDVKSGAKRKDIERVKKKIQFKTNKKAE